MYLVFVGFDYLVIGLEYVLLQEQGWIEYSCVSDEEVIDVFYLLSCIEGILFVFEIVYVIVEVK